MNQTLREPKFRACAAGKNSGKTYYTIQFIKAYATGNPKRRIHGRKVIIFDVNNEYTDFETIPLNYIPVFSASKRIEVRRVTAYKCKGFYSIFPPEKNEKAIIGEEMTLNDMMNTLYYILKNFYNGMVVAEDIMRYSSDSYGRELIGVLATQRHRGVDVHCNFQLLSKLGNPKLLGNLNYIMLGKTNDSVDRHKDKFQDYYEIIKIAEILINADYYNATKGEPIAGHKNMGVFAGSDNSYKGAFVTIDVQNNKITGKFSKEMFASALHSYINQNSMRLKSYTSQKDKNGKAKYNYSSAFDRCIEDLFDIYYGNKKLKTNG